MVFEKNIHLSNQASQKDFYEASLPQLNSSLERLLAFVLRLTMLARNHVSVIAVAVAYIFLAKTANYDLTSSVADATLASDSAKHRSLFAE